MLGSASVGRKLRRGAISEDQACFELQLWGWSDERAMQFVREQRPHLYAVGHGTSDPVEEHVLIW